jgi:hypothetical protein
MLIVPVKLTNRNDVAVDVDLKLSISLGFVDFAAEAESLPLESFVGDVSAHWKEAIGQQLRSLVPIDAHRSVHGHALFLLNKFILAAIKRRANQSTNGIDAFVLAVKDQNRGISGQTKIVFERAMVLPMVPPLESLGWRASSDSTKPLGGAVPGSERESCGDTPDTADSRNA